MLSTEGAEFLGYARRLLEQSNLLEQGEDNSFYFSEEILNTLPRKKSIHVSDRAAIFNLMIGLNGYTISIGVINSDLNGDDIVAVPLNVD